MRLHYLHFHQYGKFADVRVDFPHAKHDFHLVVGPNEAGKSTLRSAVQDLLYGIPLRSPQDFLHDLKHLALSARVSDEHRALEFKRIKANADTLRDAGHTVIPDKELAAFLGATDRGFFAKMFALDHGLLIEGGRNLLDARSDLGQMLFQSAAGIVGLGKVRDALAAEGSKLWSARRANDREYYIAQDKLTEANAALKAASLRARAWADANDDVEQLAAARATETGKLQALQIQRNRLERLRRTAPYLATLKETEAQLVLLHSVVELPDDAGQRLDAVEKALAAATQLVDLHSADELRMANALAALTLDEQVLAHADDIAKLVERCQRFGDHEDDIRAREEEVSALRREAAELAGQLGWQDMTEETLRHRLPPLPVRRSIVEATIEHGRIAQVLRSARQVLVTKEEDLVSLRSELAAALQRSVHPSLRTALSEARAQGDTAALRKGQAATAEAATTHLEMCYDALAPWCMDASQLMAQQLPSNEAVTRLEHERQTLTAEIRSARRQLTEAEDATERQALELLQYAQRHQPTTDEQVNNARRVRDLAWDALQAGIATMTTGATAFKEAMQLADVLSDRRLMDAETSARLQELQHESERRKVATRHAATGVAGLMAEHDAAAQQWKTFANAAGLAGVALEVYPQWLVRRQQALDAAATCRRAHHVLAESTREELAAHARLCAAMAESGVPVGKEVTLAELCEQVEQFITEAEAARIRREARHAQLDAAEIQAGALQAALQSAEVDLAEWNTTWVANLAKAALPADTDPAAAKGALELIEAIDEKRKKIDDIRRERIDTMKEDLRGLATLGTTLARAIAPELVGHRPQQVAEVLQDRLLKAVEIKTESGRIAVARDHAATQKSAAHAAIREANAELVPLLIRAGAGTTNELAQAIAASRRKAQLAKQAAQSQADLITAGDGVSREQIETELADADMLTLMVELQNLEVELSAAVECQTALAAEQANAQRTLAQMAGSDTAATAEARRQEALSQMSNAAERYVRVAIATKLLGWSIDKYRERKQGPMLERASAIFRDLTLGVFTRLHVEFEKENMVLEGERVDRNRHVGVASMSEGTRDQLYLALRLAALELHLGQATALPFIADDLFINYDDERTRAGLRALRNLSTKTQVVFLSHHAHLEHIVREEFGAEVSVCNLSR